MVAAVVQVIKVVQVALAVQDMVVDQVDQGDLDMVDPEDMDIHIDDAIDDFRIIDFHIVDQDPDSAVVMDSPVITWRSAVL